MISMAKGFIGIKDSTGKEWKLEINSAMPINIQDQTTNSINIKINRILDDTIALASSPTIDTYDITLTADHGVIAGNHIALLEQNEQAELFFGEVLSIATNVLTMDSPLSYAFTPANTTAFKYSHDLVVDGSTTPIIFNVINFFTDSVDITRCMFHITDGSTMDDALFGSITRLTRGVVLRKKLVNGNFINYWNIKCNGCLGQIAQIKSYDEKAPAGVYGFSAEVVYAGPQNYGVTIRLDPGESIELIIQDDLTALSSFEMILKGHFVQD